MRTMTDQVTANRERERLARVAFDAAYRDITSWEQAAVENILEANYKRQPKVIADDATAREELFALWARHGSSFESDSSEGYELADAILSSTWLAELVAAAWDEGWSNRAGRDIFGNVRRVPVPPRGLNPYRLADVEATENE